MSDLIDLYEQNHSRFGLLRPLTLLDGRYKGHVMWECECVCGTVLAVRQIFLLNGTTKSCGCGRSRFIAEARRLPEGESSFNSLLARYKKAAVRSGRAWELDEETFRALTQQSCAICGVPPLQVWNRGSRGNTNGCYIYNGVDRIDNDFGYIPGNVQPCCTACNMAKGTMSLGDFREWLYRVAVHQGFVKEG